MVFEKRLEAHQGAYYWCMRLSKVNRPHRLTKDGGVEAAVKEFWEADEWLNKNALYLDEGSRAKMAEFLEYTCDTGFKYIDEAGRKNIDIEEEVRKLVKIAREVISSIKKGVGVKYLPEQKISIENIESGKGFAELVESTEELIRRQKR